MGLERAFLSMAHTPTETLRTLALRLRKKLSIACFCFDCLCFAVCFAPFAIRQQRMLGCTKQQEWGHVMSWSMKRIAGIRTIEALPRRENNESKRNSSGFSL
jgi:hypothetical protein